MLRINEFDIEPGIYRHYKGTRYVVVNIITHIENAAVGKMEALADPLVCYRDLASIPTHVNGKPTKAHHQVYARALSEFTGIVDLGHGITVKRFVKE